MKNSTAAFLKNIDFQDRKFKVWVLAPSIESKDDTLDYYYDFSQSIAEYTAVFKLLNIDWQWQPVNMTNYIEVVATIAKEKNKHVDIPIVLNLCDGDEINGTPGVSVIKLLEKENIIYTGADEFFYTITTSKVPMKTAFDAAGVSNAAWTSFNGMNFSSSRVFKAIEAPIIIKPAVSGGSMGVGVKNVVGNEEDLSTLVKELLNGYHGWNLSADGFIAEQFITGPEYTVFICGSYNRPEDAVIFSPVERVFHPSLPEKEKFLSFDRLWEIYETESEMPCQENFYEYQLPQEELMDSLKQISWDAFVANNGMGYARVDIRMDKETKKLYILEVNAQCGISEDENFTSIGAILKFSGVAFHKLIEAILIDAIKRNQDKNN